MSELTCSSLFVCNRKYIIVLMYESVIIIDKHNQMYYCIKEIVH